MAKKYIGECGLLQQRVFRNGGKTANSSQRSILMKAEKHKKGHGGNFWGKNDC
jgi:hypothetical protein